MLERAMNNKHRQTINDDLMGEYLVVFENIAKHFQFQADLNLRDMQALPQYNYIRASLMNIPITAIAIPIRTSIIRVYAISIFKF